MMRMMCVLLAVLLLLAGCLCSVACEDARASAGKAVRLCVRRPPLVSWLGCGWLLWLVGLWLPLRLFVLAGLCWCVCVLCAYAIRHCRAQAMSTSLKV